MKTPKNSIIKACNKKEKKVKKVIDDTIYKNSLEKALNSKAKITENIHHKEKVIQRKRDIAKVKNDIENEKIIDDIGSYAVFNDKTSYKGTHSIEKERKAKIDKVIWRFILIFIFIPIIYITVIAIYDLH